MEKPFGVDASAYQEKIDWDVVAAHQPKVSFAGIRAAVSWGYQDAWFPRNWQEAKRVGILRMAGISDAIINLKVTTQAIGAKP